MKVYVDRMHDGWRYFTRTAGPDQEIDLQSRIYATYPECMDAAVRNGYDVDNAGWRHRLLMWNFQSHALDGYPTWELQSGHPAYADVRHECGDGPSSDDLAKAWDSVASVDFYTRDYSSDGSVFVAKDDRYTSGWWFATIEERDRFKSWVKELP